MQFVVDLLEKDLGLSAAFIDAQILAFLNDAAPIASPRSDDGGDAAVRRQRRVCAATFRSLGRFSPGELRFPGLDVDGLTRLLYNLLQQAGIQEVSATARCALTEFETAPGGARAARRGAPRRRRPLGRGGGARRASGAAQVRAVSELAPVRRRPSAARPLRLQERAAQLIVTIRDSSLEVPVFLREKFTPAQLASFGGVTAGTEPTEEQKLIVLAVLNKVMQGSRSTTANAPVVDAARRSPRATG